jgi:hypothetical protein
MQSESILWSVVKANTSLQMPSKWHARNEGERRPSYIFLFALYNMNEAAQIGESERKAMAF